MKRAGLVLLTVLLAWALIVGLGCGKPAATPTPKPAPAPAPAVKPPVAPTTPAGPAKPAPAPSPKPPAAPAVPATWPKSMTITSPPAGATLTVYVTAVAKIIESKLKVPTAPQTTSGSLEAAVVMLKGDAQLTGTSGAEVYYTVINKKPLPDKSGGIMRGIFWGEYESDATFVVRVDSGIKTIPELKGKRAMFSRPEQALYEDNWRASLEAYGMTEKDIILMPALGQGDAAVALREGKADAIFHHSGTPAPAYIELANAVPIRVLSLSDAAVKNVMEKAPWTKGKTIPAGAYKGMDAPAQITTALAGIMVRKDLPDDLVYAITKAVDENIADLKAVHPSFKNWTIKGLANGPYGIYHAGALKYYTEKNYLTPESIARHKEFLTKAGQSS